MKTFILLSCLAFTAVSVTAPAVAASDCDWYIQDRGWCTEYFLQ